MNRRNFLGSVLSTPFFSFLSFAKKKDQWQQYLQQAVEAAIWVDPHFYSFDCPSSYSLFTYNDANVGTGLGNIVRSYFEFLSEDAVRDKNWERTEKQYRRILNFIHLSWKIKLEEE
jgi:hypothetical protein